jgi:hypothetical protein
MTTQESRNALPPFIRRKLKLIFSMNEVLDGMTPAGAGDVHAMLASEISWQLVGG